MLAKTGSESSYAGGLPSGRTDGLDELSTTLTRCNDRRVARRLPLVDESETYAVSDVLSCANATLRSRGGRSHGLWA